MANLFDHEKFIKTFAFVHGRDGLEEDDLEFLNLFSHMDAPPLVKIQALKDMGNDLFRQNQFDPAGECYDKACRLLCFSIQSMEDMDVIAVSDMAVSLNLNLAACANKLKAFEAAINFSSMVLHAFPKNAKALFRRGVAHLKLNNLLEARNDLEHAFVVESKNKDILRELNVVKNLLEINSNGKREVGDFLVGIDERKNKKLTPTLEDKKGRIDEGVIVETCDTSFSDSCSSSESNVVEMETSSVAEHGTSDMDLGSVSDYPSIPETFHFKKKGEHHIHLNLDARMYQNLVAGKDVTFYHKKLFSTMKIKLLQPLKCDSEPRPTSININISNQGKRRRRRTKGGRRRKSDNEMGKESTSTEDKSEDNFELLSDPKIDPTNSKAEFVSVPDVSSKHQPFIFASEGLKRRRIIAPRRIIRKRIQSQEDESPGRIFGVFDTLSSSLPRSRSVSVSCRRYSSEALKRLKRKEMASQKNLPKTPTMKKPRLIFTPSPSVSVFSNLSVCSSTVITASDSESHFKPM